MLMSDRVRNIGYMRTEEYSSLVSAMAYDDAHGVLVVGSTTGAVLTHEMSFPHIDTFNVAEDMNGSIIADSTIIDIAFTIANAFVAAIDRSGYIYVWYSGSMDPVIDPITARDNSEDVPRAMEFTDFNSNIKTVWRDGTIRTFSLLDGSRQRVEHLDMSSVDYAKFSNTGRTLFCLDYTLDNKYCIFDVRSGSGIYGNYYGTEPMDVFISNDTVEVAYVDSVNTARIQSYFINGDPQGHGEFFIYAGTEVGAFSPDGSCFAIDVGNDVRVVDLNFPNDPYIATFSGVKGTNIYDIEFSSDGEYLFAAGTDDRIYIWKIPNGHIFPSRIRGECIGFERGR